MPVGVDTVAPQAGDRCIEIAHQAVGRRHGHGEITCLAREARGKGRGLETLGLRPEPRTGVMRRVIVEQAVHREVVAHAGARLWPQTERLKAASIAARLTGEARYFSMAVAAADTLLRYLDTPIPGLWRDPIDATGKVVDEPAPAAASTTWWPRSRKSARWRASDQSRAKLQPVTGASSLAARWG